MDPAPTANYCTARKGWKCYRLFRAVFEHLISSSSFWRTAAFVSNTNPDNDASCRPGPKSTPRNLAKRSSFGKKVLNYHRPLNGS